MLFMLNNSQDEILMAYTDFCKKTFIGGLPDPEYGRLPKTLTNNDLNELRSYLSREVLTENQFKTLFSKNLDEPNLW